MELVYSQLLHHLHQFLATLLLPSPLYAGIASKNYQVIKKILWEITFESQ
jgi:hypothetical protein